VKGALERESSGLRSLRFLLGLAGWGWWGGGVMIMKTLTRLPACERIQ
jgi:hypothetical protein